MKSEWYSRYTKVENKVFTLSLKIFTRETSTEYYADDVKTWSGMYINERVNDMFQMIFIECVWISKFWLNLMFHCAVENYLLKLDEDSSLA